MRKANAIITALIMVLLLVHMILGGFQLAGLLQGGNILNEVSAMTMLFLICVHTVLGVILTVKSVKLLKKSGAHYFKENKLFWLRRISGFAVMLFVAAHVLIFLGRHTETGAYRLSFFGPLQLAVQILMVLSIALHVITNVRPMMISFGIKSYKDLGIDIMLILSILLMLAGAAFVVYYIRWL